MTTSSTPAPLSTKPSRGKRIAATRDTAETAGAEIAAIQSEIEQMRVAIARLAPNLNTDPGSWDTSNMAALIEAKACMALLQTMGVPQEKVALMRALAAREVVAFLLQAAEAQAAQARGPQLLVPETAKVPRPLVRH